MLRKTVRGYASKIQSSRLKKFLTVLFLLISLAVVAGILRANWGSLTEHNWEFRPGYIAATLFLVQLTFGLTALTWHLIISRFLPQTTLRMNVKIWAYSNFARRIPGAIWYVASRSAMYEREKISKSVVAFICGFEVIIILVSGSILSLVTVPFWGSEVSSLTDMRWVAVLLPVGVLLLHPRFINFLTRKFFAQHSVKKVAFTDIVIGTTAYAVVWLSGALAFYAIINIVQEVSFLEFGKLVNIWAIANTLSFAGGLAFVAFGVRDVSLTLLLSLVTTPPIAIIVTIIMRLLWVMSELVAGLISLRL